VDAPAPGALVASGRAPRYHSRTAGGSGPRRTRVGIDWYLLLPLIPVFLLAILVTGPGMWSDRLGFWWVRKAERREPRPRGRR
jgi:hypothetical protein